MLDLFVIEDDIYLSESLISIYFKPVYIRAYQYFIKDSKLNSIENPEWMFKYLLKIIVINLEIFKEN